MKGYFGCSSAIFQKFKKIKRYLLEEFCQEVLTLHLLTITLRRNLNPPGFFFFNGKRTEGFQNESKKIFGDNNHFDSSILLISLVLLRFFNNCSFEGIVRDQLNRVHK